MSRGFTLLEMTVNLSILALMLPLAFSGYRTLDASQQQAKHQLEAVRGMRTFSETLDADLLHMTWSSDEGLQLEGDCGQVRYTAREGVLLREGDPACGQPVQGLARGVRSIERGAHGIQVNWKAAERDIVLWRGP